MLQLDVEMGFEQWDEAKEEFIQPKVKTIQLEHSLVSLYKWESRWHKPFLTKKPLTDEEALDYIKCMALTKDVPQEVFDWIAIKYLKQVFDYIENPMTATTFRKDDNKKSSREIVTAEIIYYWMISLGIPFECQKWHLNKLLTLIQVCNIKNQPPKKRSKKEILRSNAALNAERRKKLNTRG